MTKVETRLLAKCTGADVRIEDHGIPYLSVGFDYDEGSSQGLGVYVLDGAFVFRFMLAMGIEALSEAKETSCWVVQGEDGMIAEVHPLHRKGGTPFVIEEWRRWIVGKNLNLSAYEMRTGKKP